MEVRPATRKSAKPLMGLFSQSGAGKTYTALLFARGYVGPTGRIVMIETESGRGEAYSDPREYPELAGPDSDRNYDVISLHDDFSPAKYGDGIAAAERAKADALIIDSASHEWEGIGGVLSMAAENDAKGMKGVLVWQQPKILHKREFMLRFMQTPIPLVILCMRAKYPMEQVKGKWQRAEDLEPIQAEDILYEMFVYGWIDMDHKFHMTKPPPRGLAPVFDKVEPLGLDHGRRMAAWARGEQTPAGTDRSSGPSDPPSDRKASGPAGTSNDLAAIKASGLKAAERGFDVAKEWWTTLDPKTEQRPLAGWKDLLLLPRARGADAAKDSEDALDAWWNGLDAEQRDANLDHYQDILVPMSKQAI